MAMMLSSLNQKSWCSRDMILFNSPGKCVDTDVPARSGLLWLCRYNALVYVPYQLERLLWFGTFICCDSFLVSKPPAQ